MTQQLTLQVTDLLRRRKNMRLNRLKKGGNALMHDRLAGLAVLVCLLLGSANLSAQLQVYTSRATWEAEMANIVNEDLESVSGQIIDLKTTPTTVGTHHFAGSGSNGGAQISSFPGGLMENTTRIEMGGTTGGTPKTTVTIPVSFGIAFDWKTSAPSPNGAHNSLYLRVNAASGNLTKLLNQSTTEGFIGIISPCGGITAYEIYTTLANFQSFNMDNFSYGDLAGGLPDADNDGTPDCTDGCPNDPDKINPGACGCGVADVDNDHDGYYACDDDCDDDNSAIHPGADEICDGIDNDCDGLVDTDDPDYVPGPLPDITCQDITVTFAGEAEIELNPEDVASYTDNCDVTGVSIDTESIPCSAAGTVLQVEVTLHGANNTAKTCKSDVTVAGLPCGWSAQPDGIGCTDGNQASFDPNSGTITVNSAGCYSSSASSDESGFAGFQLCGDGSVTVHIAGLTLPGYAGVTMRENALPGARKVALVYQGANVLQRFVRYVANGPSYPSFIPTGGSRWLRIVRTGNIFKGYHSYNGSNWSLAFTVTVPMSSCIQIGLTSSGTSGNSAVTATFDNLTIDPPFGGNPQRPGAAVQAIEQTVMPEMALFPNPTGGAFTLQLNEQWTGAVSMDILDQLGRTVINRTIDANADPTTELDLHGVAPGVYTVRISDATGRSAFKKLIITR